jgi:hypothetical protein
MGLRREWIIHRVFYGFNFGHTRFKTAAKNFVSRRACCTFVARGKRCMHNSDYYREEAVKYRKLAEGEKDAAAKQEFLELAAACEEAADKIDDCRASG